MQKDYTNYFTASLAGANPAHPQPVRFDTGAFKVARIKTGKPWVDTVFNGIAEGDCRYPDPFTLVKSNITVISSTSSLTSMSTSSNSSSSSYDWTCYGHISGSPVYTYWVGAAPGTYIYDWNANSTGAWANCGGGSSLFYNRPIGVVTDFIPRLVGPVHTVKFFAVPIMPTSKAEMNTSAVGGWPAAMNSGLTPVSIYWGGREWEIDSTSKGVRLCCLPWDSRAFDFALGSLERNGTSADAKISWSGWIFWAVGMTQADRFDVVTSFVEENMPATNNSTNLAYPSAFRKSDSWARDDMVNQVKNLADSGAAGYSFIDTVVDVAKSAWGVGKKLYNIWGSLAGGGLFNPAPALFRIEDAHESKETKEDYDFPRRESIPMATPRQPIGLRPRNPTDDDQSLLKSSTSALARK